MFSLVLMMVSRKFEGYQNSIFDGNLEYDPPLLKTKEHKIHIRKFFMGVIFDQTKCVMACSK